MLSPNSEYRHEDDRRNVLMIEAVLFDIGDVLMHFETSRARRFLDVGVRPVYDALIERGHRPPAFAAYARRIRWAFVRAYLWSRTIRREVATLDVLRRAHARMGIALSPGRMEELAMQCMRPFEQFFSTDPQAVPVVSRLREAGFKLGIVSNTFFPHFAIDEVLEREGLLELFPVRIYSSDVGFMKPHPGIFRAALDRLDVAPERTMHVGDLIRKDVRGAARVGIQSVLLLPRGQRVSGHPKPDYVIRDLTELLTLPGIKERIGASASSVVSVK